VKESSIASALKAIVATGPGNAVSIAGTMESNEDGTQGKLNIVGNFETIPGEVLKAHSDAQDAADKARGKKK